MPIISLGTRQLNLYEGWLSFDPIDLDRKKSYALLIRQTCGTPRRLFSSLDIRFARELDTQEIGRMMIAQRIFYSPLQTALIFGIPAQFDGTKQTIFEAQRVAFYDVPSEAAILSVELRIDPDNDENYEF